MVRKRERKREGTRVRKRERREREIVCEREKNIGKKSLCVRKKEREGGRGKMETCKMRIAEKRTGDNKI